MSKLDELFREKLTDFTVTPPRDTWPKVEARLSKKNKAVWLRWAAALLLGGLLLGTLWVVRDGQNSLPLTKENKPDQKKTETETQSQPIPPVITEDNKEKQNPIRQKQQKMKSVGQAVLEAQAIKEVVPIVTEEQSSQQVEASPLVSPPSQSIVLTYTLESIERPIEEKSPEIDVAQANQEIAPTVKKDKSLKRMMQFAKGVKNGDTPVTGLRDMKEDLFALDLRKKTTGKKQ